MKLVTVGCRSILGTDFACKPLYRFKFVNKYNTRLPALSAVEVPDEKLKINELGADQGHSTASQGSCHVHSTLC